LSPGDEIVTTPITFVATQATAASFGAKIIFADVEQDTANIDPAAVESAITSKTKAIVAVDYAGHPAALNELRKIADSRGIYLIEDASHSIGSTYYGKPVGSIADLTTFSFFPTKNLTTGEGGAISSTNPQLLNRAKLFARQGVVRSTSEFKLEPDGPWHQEVHSFGLNYRLPDLLCALGISQLKRLKEFKIRRREVFDFYQNSLRDLDWIQLPVERDNISANWHLFPIRVPKSERRRIFEFLQQNNIGVQVNYIPVYRHPVFADYRINPKLFPVSEQFYSQEISVPMHVGLSDFELDFIVKTLRKSY
jgi:dTDP-4-amino-4,6-dideoxygalactose transaminase